MRIVRIIFWLVALLALAWLCYLAATELPDPIEIVEVWGY